MFLKDTTRFRNWIWIDLGVPWRVTHFSFVMLELVTDKPILDILDGFKIKFIGTFTKDFFSFFCLKDIFPS